MEGKIILLVILSAFVSRIDAAPQPRECPERAGMTNFDIDRFSGRWYGKLAVNATLFAGVKCFQEKYIRVPKEKNYTIYSMYVADEKTGQERVANGTALIGNGTSVGKFDVVLSPKSDAKTIRTDYILHTDYENFAIAVTCIKVYMDYHETFWVYSRRPLVETHIIGRIFDLIKSLGWNLYEVKWIDQSCGAIRWTPDEIRPYYW